MAHTENIQNQRRVSETGGAKEAKLACFSLLPAEALTELAEVYGFGARKYAPHNWRKGYPYSWSQDALGRHLAAFAQGVTLDPESGCHHLAHAAFHILTLLSFELDAEKAKALDDRPSNARK